MSDPFNRVPAGRHVARHSKLRWAKTPPFWVVYAWMTLLAVAVVTGVLIGVSR